MLHMIFRSQDIVSSKVVCLHSVDCAMVSYYEQEFSYIHSIFQCQGNPADFIRFAATHVYGISGSAAHGHVHGGTAAKEFVFFSRSFLWRRCRQT